MESEEERVNGLRWADAAFDAIKDDFAKNRFADAFVDILREVNRQEPRGLPGVSELSDYNDALKRGARVKIGELTRAAFERIQPPERYFGDDEYGQCKQALLDVALAGLAFLIENAATDEVAKSRRTIRKRKLEMAIREYNEAHEARRRRERNRRVSRPTGKRRP
jgi:hypothetical protein